MPAVDVLNHAELTTNCILVLSNTHNRVLANDTHPEAASHRAFLGRADSMDKDHGDMTFYFAVSMKKIKQSTADFIKGR